MFSLVFFSSGWTKFRNVSHLVTMIVQMSSLFPFIVLSSEISLDEILYD
jgi:hypothetical protein